MMVAFGIRFECRMLFDREAFHEYVYMPYNKVVSKPKMFMIMQRPFQS
jgi:hypothetical protein